MIKFDVEGKHVRKPRGRSMSTSLLALMVAGCGGGGARQIVTPPNVAPTADADKTVTLDEDASAQPLAIAAPSDSNNDPLTISVTQVPDDGTVRLGDGSSTLVTVGTELTSAQLTQLQFNASRGFDGNAGAFAYSVSDDNGASTSQTIDFIINNTRSDVMNNIGVEGGIVFLDQNGDGQVSDGEPTSLIDASGRYEILEGTGVLTALAERDDLTGLRFGEDAVLLSNGGTVFSPLNTLLFYAADPADILSKTGLQDELDNAGVVDLPNFDAAALSLGLGGSAADEIIQLNQDIVLAVTALRTLYQLTDVADPNAAAYEALAQNLIDRPEGAEIGLSLAEDFAFDVIADIAQDLTGLPDFIASTLDGIVSFISGEIRSFLEFGLDLLEVDPIGAVSPLRRAVMEKYTVDAADLLQQLRDPAAFDDIVAGLIDIREQLTLGIDEVLERYITFDNIEFAPRSSVPGTVVETLGTDGEDELNGHNGNDRLIGGAGDDVLLPGLGDDETLGGEGDDVIVDLQGDALSSGGAGDDTLIVWEGSQLLDGGEGEDILALDDALARIVLEDGALDVESAAATLQFSIDAGAGTLSSASIDETFFDAAPILGLEEYRLPGDADITFIGSTADEILSVDLSRDGGFGQLIYTASDGDDQVISRAAETLGGDEDIFDLSGLSTAATFGGEAMPLIVHGAGSLDLDGVFGDFVGTDNGDIINTRPLEFFDGLLPAGTDALSVSYTLGSGADLVVLKADAASFVFQGFDIASDSIDLSGVERLAGEAFTSETLSDALLAVDVDGTPSTQLTYDDDGTSASTALFVGVTPDQLPADTFIFTAPDV